MWQGLRVGTVGATFNEHGYTVQRIVLFFDTSPIPDDATIVSATLRLFSDRFKNGDSSFHVARSLASFPPTRKDFGRVEFQSAGVITDPGTEMWLKLELADHALSWIDVSGITKLALVHDLDLRNFEPDSPNDILIRLSEHSEQFKPRLVVIYRQP